jgi:uncharacterized protein YkwD
MGEQHSETGLRTTRLAFVFGIVAAVFVLASIGVLVTASGGIGISVPSVGGGGGGPLVGGGIPLVGGGGSQDAAAGQTTPRPRLSHGDIVSVQSSTTAWHRGGRGTAQPGLAGEVVKGPDVENGTKWYKLRSATGYYWVGRQALARNPDARAVIPFPPRFEVGDRVTFPANTTGWQKQRQYEMKRGGSGSVIEGPTRFGNRTWYKVRLDRGRFWIREGALSGPNSDQTANITQGTTRGFDLDEVERRFLAKLNKERRSRGLQPVRRRGILTHMGREHSQHMLRNDYINHTASDGDTVTDRYVQYGLLPACELDGQNRKYYPGLENIAQTHVDRTVESDWAPDGRYTVENEADLAWAIYTMWMHSTPHKKAMLLRSADQAGLGIAINETGYTLASLELC